MDVELVQAADGSLVLRPVEWPATQPWALSNYEPEPEGDES